MKESYCHIFLTRFNVVHHGKWDKDKNKNKVLDEEWLEHRFKVFERYCLPSIINQTNLNFKWLVFFDIKTSSYFRKKIEDIKEKNSFFTPYFVKSFEEIQTNLSDYINNFIKPENSHLITTRIDNDDSFHNTFVDMIHNKFDYQKRTFINFLNGYIYDENHKILIRKNNYQLNPLGISLVEKIQDGEFITVWCDEHTELDKYGKIINIDNLPCWIQMHHKKNILNSLFGSRNKMILRPPVFLFDKNLFGLSKVKFSILKSCSFSLYFALRYFYNLVIFKILGLVSKFKVPK